MHVGRSKEFESLSPGNFLKLQEMLRAHQDGVTAINIPGNKVGMYDGKYSPKEELSTMYLNGCIATIIQIRSKNMDAGILTHFTQLQWIHNLEKIEDLIRTNLDFKACSCKSVVVAPSDLSVHMGANPIEALLLKNSLLDVLGNVKYTNEIVPYAMTPIGSGGLIISFDPKKHEWESQQHGRRKL